MLEHCHHKNECSSCITTKQIKSRCLRKLKTFKKIYKMLKMKSKCAPGLLKLQKSTPQLGETFKILIYCLQKQLPHSKTKKSPKSKIKKGSSIKDKKRFLNQG